jgi:hypothetical protein
LLKSEKICVDHVGELLKLLNLGEVIQGGSDAHKYMHQASQEALRITAVLNGSYHTPDEIRSLMSELIGKPVDESFGLFL